MRAVILQVGLDPTLLETRALVLQSAGYIVVSMNSAQEGLARFAVTGFDLVVLCHSIPKNDREDFIRFIRARNSLTPVIVVGTRVAQLDVLANATIESDPHKFVATIQRFLKKQKEQISHPNQRL